MAGRAAITDSSSQPLNGVASLSSDGLIAFLNGWHAEAWETPASGSSWELQAYAICMRT
ncbi:MAG: hypothetical protein JWM71_1408 [Solirubrobacteraceae bacterium]|nr:hypothetical protein [Solirubrobacteraceae bacterium]